MITTCQIIAPGTGAASYVSPRRTRTTIVNFAVHNPTAAPITAIVKVNGVIVDYSSVLGYLSWTPMKLIRQILEPGDILQFAGESLNRMASGYREAVKP